MRILFIAPLILAAFGGCRHESPAETSSAAGAPPGEVWMTPQQIKDAHIELEPLAKRPVGGVIKASGRVTFDDLRVGHVFSPVSGKVTRILVNPGQRVKKGQALCVIQSPDLGSAISDMAKAQASLFQAEKDWKRQKELLEVNAAAQRDYEAAESVYLNAKAEMERAQRKAKLLRGAAVDSVTQEYSLPSPIDGEVIARAANPGLEVQGQYSGGANVELFTVGELDRVWVIADVFEMDLPRVKNGQQVAVTVLSYPGERFVGHVEWISGSLDPISRTAKVRCSIDNPKLLLRPEMFGVAEITVAADTRLAIKRSALLLLGEQPVAFAQKGTTPDGQLKFERRVVAVEEMPGGDYVPIISGIAEGETTVTSGGVLLLEKL